MCCLCCFSGDGRESMSLSEAHIMRQQILVLGKAGLGKGQTKSWGKSKSFPVFHIWRVKYASFPVLTQALKANSTLSINYVNISGLVVSDNCPCSHSVIYWMVHTAGPSVKSMIINLREREIKLMVYADAFHVENQKHINITCHYTGQFSCP